MKPDERFCPKCGTRIDTKENKRLKDMLRDEQKMVALWSNFYYVTDDDIDTVKRVEFDATETERLLHFIYIIDSLNGSVKNETE